MDQSHVSMHRSQVPDDLQSQHRNIYTALGLGIIDSNTADRLLQMLEVDLVATHRSETDEGLTDFPSRTPASVLDTIRRHRMRFEEAEALRLGAATLRDVSRRGV